MGAAKIALALALLVPAAPAYAENDCTGVTRTGDRFAVCFDPGNRFEVTATTDGYGGAIRLRHTIHFDDEPDLTWRMEHVILRGRARFESGEAGITLYSGRYVRHARDGHIVLPFAVARKLFLPFDVGGEVEAGHVHIAPESDELDVGIVRVAAIVDLARSVSFRRRLSFGAVTRWDATVGRSEIEIAEHRVAPMTNGALGGRIESVDGLTIATADLEAGRMWSSKRGWYTEVRAEASLERVVLAINDRPIALVVGARYLASADEGLAEVGVRFVPFGKRHRRVVLDPL